MTKYVGTKLIEAEPRQKDGKDGYKVVYDDGYVSWSPKDVFEKAYNPVKKEIRDLMKPDLPDYIKHMLVEEAELEVRIEKLHRFFNKHVKNELEFKLSNEQQEFLTAQYSAMSNYAEILDIRITNELKK